MFGNANEPFTIARDVAAIIIPVGEALTLRAGTSGFITQALGGSSCVCHVSAPQKASSLTPRMAIRIEMMMPAITTPSPRISAGSSTASSLLMVAWTSPS